jgi:glycolate oxidase FAD binding subunit
VLSVRLSGSRAAVEDARGRLGGQMMQAASADAFWAQIREQAHPFFAGEETLWRVCVPSTAPPLELHGRQLIEWGGSLRWSRTPQAAQEVRAIAQQGGGHATLFRGAPACDVFTPLPAPLLAIHQRLKAHFDPAGIFNPGRLYRDL